MNTVYVDTSVFGGCFDPEFSEHSNKLMEEFKKGEKRMMISAFVFEELAPANKLVRQVPDDVPKIFKTIAGSSPKTRKLANKYIAAGILSMYSKFDAMHIAIATLQGADILASWNFKHIVHADKIKLFNQINKDMGYRMINIKTPRQILNP